MKIDQVISCNEISSQLSWDPLVECVREILPGVPYERKAPFLLDVEERGERFADFHDEVLSATTRSAVPINLFKFRDALVFGQGSVVVDGGMLLRDSALEFLAHSLAPDGSEADGAGFRLLHDAARRSVCGTSILVKRPWYRNFGHWLVDLMPILPVLGGQANDFDQIIFGDVGPGQLRELMHETAQKWSPRAELIFMADTEQLRCETLYYLQPVHVPPTFKHPLAIQAASAAARELFPSASERQRPKRIYVSRAGIVGREVEK